MKKRRLHFLHRLLLPAILAMLPILVLSGGMAGSAQAGAPLPTSTGASTTRPHQTVLRVYFLSNAQRDSLAVELGAEEMTTGGGYLTVLGDDSMLRDLQARGIKVEVDKALTVDANSVYFGSNAPDTFFGGYKTVEEMQSFLDAQVAAHPGLAAKVDYGDSWCKMNPGSCTQPSPYNGYDMLAMHITNQAIPGPKPVFWFETGIHSREIATPEVSMRYIAMLLDNYDTNADIHWLVDYHDIWVVPMVNPDGHHIVEAGGGGNSPYYQRKNANNSNGCTTYPPSSSTQFGTDNNRNFDFLWNCCGGSSSGTCDQTYHGPTAASDPETMFTEAKLRSLIPDQRGPNITDAAPITTTGVYQSMHSNASLNLFPWGFQTTPHAPNDAELRNIGKHMQATNAFPSGNNYQTGQPPELLYAVDGDTSDWGYGELGAASYTTEIGGSGFFPTYSTIDSSIWPQNKGALLYQAKIARTPYLLSHGPDATNLPAAPLTATVGSTVQLAGTINYTWASNSFSQNVGAAEYYVDTPPWAGGTAQPMQPTDGNFNSPTEGVQAGLDTTGLSLGRHLVFVRGRGATDFSGYQTWGPVTALFVDVIAGGTPSATAIASTATGTATSVSVTASATGTVPATGTAQTTATASPAVSTTQTAQTTATSAASTSTSTSIATASATSTVCPIKFQDVSTSNTFYPYVRCLACRNILGGYACGAPGEPCGASGNPYFRPGVEISRGQIAKIVAQAASLNDDPGTQIYEDVPTGSPFFVYIQRLSNRGYMGGYPCGQLPTETCIAPGNRPYFRPSSNATRGQLSKIVSNASQNNDTVVGQTYQDVSATSPFYLFIERLSGRSVMSGYPCGGVGEGCVAPDNRPYFRPNANVTRGQASKIVSNTFFPNCETQTPARP